MGDYKPRYDDDAINRESDQPNISGYSPRENVRYEEAAQRRVAEQWLIAKEVNRYDGGDKDSKAGLEALGFTGIESANPLFYRVTPPRWLD